MPTSAELLIVVTFKKGYYLLFIDGSQEPANKARRRAPSGSFFQEPDCGEVFQGCPRRWWDSSAVRSKPNTTP